MRLALTPLFYYCNLRSPVSMCLKFVEPVADKICHGSATATSARSCYHFECPENMLVRDYMQEESCIVRILQELGTVDTNPRLSLALRSSRIPADTRDPHSYLESGGTLTARDDKRRSDLHYESFRLEVGMITSVHGVHCSGLDTDHNPGEVFHQLYHASEQAKEHETEGSTYSAEEGAASEVEQKRWKESRHFGTAA